MHTVYDVINVWLTIKKNVSCTITNELRLCAGQAVLNTIRKVAAWRRSTQFESLVEMQQRPVGAAGQTDCDSAAPSWYEGFSPEP